MASSKLSKLSGIAIIGAGKAARALAGAVRACPRALLIRVMSRTIKSARQLAGDFKIPTFGNKLEDVLSDPDVQAVLIASPDRFHCEQAVAAARAGKHVLCEKPMCNSEEEAVGMITAAERSGVVLMIGFTERFNQPCLEAHERIKNGEIGAPVMLLARRCHPKSMVRNRAWLNDEETGGVLNYAGTHNIDLICWFMGDCYPERVYAETGRRVLDSGQRFTDSAVMTFRFRKGGIAALYESFGYPDPYPHGVDRSIEILGTKGRALIDFMRQPLSIDSDRGHVLADSTTWPAIPDSASGAMANEIRHFVSAIIEKTPVLTPGAAGLRAIRVAAAAKRAAATGLAQHLPEGKKV